MRFGLVGSCLLLWPGFQLCSPAVGEEGAALPAPRCEPVIHGVLWWVDPAAHGPKLLEILDAMDRVGMNTLWILGPQTWLIDPAAPLLERIYAEADRRRWRVILATSGMGDWYHRWDIPALVKTEEADITDLARRYGRHSSFFGWYINYEIYMEWDEKSRMIRRLYNRIGELTRQATPTAKLTISPFFLADKNHVRGDFRYATPDEYGRWWSETIRQAGIDVVMLQDSGAEHCECVEPSTRMAFLDAMRRAAVARGAELWGNVEMVEYRAKDWGEYGRRLRQHRASGTAYPWSFDMKRNALKLDLASRYCTDIVSWGWEFWNPALPQTEVGDSRASYAAYQEYLRTLPTTRPVEPQLKEKAEEASVH
ncbi:MAG TPA: DUF4434 domain-containing protein [Phycisphaerae bacterium]|nr:DUF4434 domain-containing protein [Phycisphaerae bacterium]HRY68950.1 DUF4434 domain-containing protein [Phycisphaerae bacterium]HSA25777.1 DUF4434 domain-containing protein [Phycisphaerae bacterium]